MQVAHNLITYGQVARRKRHNRNQNKATGVQVYSRPVERGAEYKFRIIA